MKFRTTLILLLLVLAGAAAVYLLEQHAPSTEERAHRKRHVVDFDPERTEWLRIQTAAYTVTCRRHGPDWVLTEPIAARANIATVNRILANLEEWPRIETLRGADLRRRDLSAEDYGLHPPRAEITWGDALTQRSLRIGRDAPMGDALYVQRDNEQDILVAAPTLWEALPEEATEFRSRRLFEGSPQRTTRLEIKRPEGFLRLVRAPDGAWTLQQPDRGRADATFVNDLIEALHEARAQTFVTDLPGDFAPYGLDVPRVEISLTSPGDLLPQTLFLGNDVEGPASAVYARIGDAGGVVTVDRGIYQTALIDPNVLRDRRLLNWDPADVAHLKIRAGDEAVTFDLDPATGQWWLMRPVRRKANQELVNALIASWCNAAILEFVADDEPNLADFSLDPPVYRITLATGPLPAAGGAVPTPSPDDEPDALDAPATMPRFVTVALGTIEAERERLFVRREDRSAVFALDLQMLQRLSVAPTFFFDHEVLRLEADTVRSLTVERDGARQAVERGTDGLFQPAGAPNGTTADRERIATLLETLRSVRALEFLPFAPTELAAYGLESPTDTLTIRFTEGAGISQSILFGAPFNRVGRYATIRGQDILFVLPNDIADRLLTDLLHVPAPPADSPTGDTGEDQDHVPPA